MDGQTETGPGAEAAGHNPVRALDLVVAFGGAVVLLGLALEWSGGTGYEGISVLRILVIAVAVAGLALPVVLRATSKTDIPVIQEALLAPLASIVFLIVAIRIAFPPEGGAGLGMVVAAAGLLLCSAACWKALSRET